MKWLYGIALFLSWIILLIIYFINLVYLSSTRMFLFSTTTNIPLSLWLLVIILLSYLLWALTVLFFRSLIKSKPKDIFEDDF